MLHQLRMRARAAPLRSACAAAAAAAAAASAATTAAAACEGRAGAAADHDDASAASSTRMAAQRGGVDVLYTFATSCDGVGGSGGLTAAPLPPGKHASRIVTGRSCTARYRTSSADRGRRTCELPRPGAPAHPAPRRSRVGCAVPAARRALMLPCAVRELRTAKDEVFELLRRILSDFGSKIAYLGVSNHN